MQEKKIFYCYIDKLVCSQAAIFNPTIEIKISNKQGILRSSSSNYPTFFFRQKFKCIISNKNEFDNTSVTFIIHENSTELMKKSIGFSFLNGNIAIQDLEIQNENCDKIKLFFRAMVDPTQKEPRWYSSINAPAVNASIEGVKSVDSSILDDFLLLSSSDNVDENDYLSEIDQTQKQNVNQNEQLHFYDEKSQTHRITQSLPDNHPIPPKKLIQNQVKSSNPKRRRKSSSISFGEEEDNQEEEEDIFIEDMPPYNDNHIITAIELFVKAKYELLYRAANERIGYDIGVEFMKISPINFTLDQKYAVLFIENYIKSLSIKTIEIDIRFFNSLLTTYQMVQTNKQLIIQIKHILKMLIENIYKAQSKDLISYVINALKAESSSRIFSSNANKILKLRKIFNGDSGKYLFSEINEYLDCEICNLMITKMEFNTYSIVLASSDNLPQFETLSGLLFPRLRQSFKAIIMRNNIISSPLIVKKQMPLLSSTFVFYLLSVVKPDKAIPQPLPFEKLQKFALTAKVEFRDPIEKCLLKPRRLCLPKTMTDTYY